MCSLPPPPPRKSRQTRGLSLPSLTTSSLVWRVALRAGGKPLYHSSPAVDVHVIILEDGRTAAKTDPGTYGGGLNSAEFTHTHTHTHTQTLTQTHIDTAAISVEAELLFVKYDKVYCSALLLLTIILVPLTPNPSLLTFSNFTQLTLIIIDDHIITATLTVCEMQFYPFCLRVWAVQLNLE